MLGGRGGLLHSKVRGRAVYTGGTSFGDWQWWEGLCLMSGAGHMNREIETFVPPSYDYRAGRRSGAHHAMQYFFGTATGWFMDTSLGVRNSPA